MHISGQTYTSHSEQETGEIAAKCAKSLRRGDVVCLHGDLGAGKSVFARALIRFLCANQSLNVPSPTFTLAETYETQSGLLWHFDLYRLEDPEEIHEIGWEEALTDGIVLVEWPSRLGSYLPAQRLDIHIQGVDNDMHARTIHIERIQQ